MPHTYREDTDRKDQGWALFDKGSTPPVPDKDGPVSTNTIAPTSDEDDGTYETLSK
jgi:hypothetical protein